MSKPEINLLAIDRGTIVAPAGCGKTQLIAEALIRYNGSKPILVLTHTNAGVAALRKRLEKSSVPSKKYRIQTIDGWAMRLISMFPLRSGHNPNILNLSAPETDYPAIRDAAWKLLRSGHISDLIQASYERLIVDEYQDCSKPQHAIIFYVANTLKTCLLGDPLQAIFNFSEPLADWENHVCKHFPVVAELDIPWRWKNVGKEAFGEWLLSIRALLLNGSAIDLSTAPEEVSVKVLNGVNNHEIYREVAATPPATRRGGVLVIGDSRNPLSRQLLASQTFGASAVEAVDLKDLVSFGQTFNLKSESSLERLLDFSVSVMTNVEKSNLLKRVASLSSGRAKVAATDVENSALCFAKSPSYKNALRLMQALNNKSGTRVFRPVVFRGCLSALHGLSNEVGFYEATVRVREQNRLLGRPLPSRAIGSTLLLKGLEAEVAVILNADELNAQNLYVAMTRGSMKLVICAKSNLIKFKK